MAASVVDQPQRTPRRRDPLAPSRNWVLAWVVTVAVLMIAISLVVLKGDRVDEGDAPREYPGVVSAEQIARP